MGSDAQTARARTGQPADERVVATSGHPRDYYHRPGMPLRPSSERPGDPEIWSHVRATYFTPVMPPERLVSPTPIVALVNDHQWQGDEEMDGVVRAFRRTGMATGRRMLDQALAEGIDAVDGAPPELVALFEALDNPPAWYDAAEFERGREVWISASHFGKTGMGMIDTLATFVGLDVSSATGATNRFTRDYARRMFETFAWFHSVTRPEITDRYSAPFRDVIMVRLMHAQVRAGLRRSWGEDHFARFGSPLSAASMVVGAITFGMLPVLVDQAHGRRFAEADRDAAMYYWSCLAYFMGVPDAIIPRTSADAVEVAHAMFPDAGGPTDGTAAMTGAAVEALSNEKGLTLAGKVLAPMILGGLAHYGGEPVTRALIGTTPIRAITIRPYARIFGLVVNANVRFNAILDRLPFAAARRRRKARTGDPYNRFQLAMFRRIAARSGITSTPFDHHDDTPNTPGGCPIG